MPPKKSRKQKETIKYIEAAPVIDRWQMCQKIGKAFYHTELTNEAISAIKTTVENSDGMKQIIKHIFKLK